MQFLLSKASRLRINWNKKQLTEEDFYTLCRRRNIEVIEMPLRTGGFYFCVDGRHHIALDSRLRGASRLFIMFHEFAHYLMHAPEHGPAASFHGIGRKTRNELEADGFALCALIPRTLLETKTFEELAGEDGLTHKMLLERKRIFDLYGV